MTKFIPPTFSEVVDYFEEKKFTGSSFNEAGAFIDFYESKNWYVGKNKMAKWKSAVSGWIRRSNQNNPPVLSQSPMQNLTDTTWSDHLTTKKQIGIKNEKIG